MAKQVILERVEPLAKVAPFNKLLGPEEGVAPRSRAAPGVDNGDTGEIRRRLRLAYEDKRRSYQNLSDETNLGFAWRSLSEAERQALLESDDDGEDPIFKETIVNPEIVVGKLSDFALEVRAELIRKAQPGLSREKAFAAACDEKPWLLKIARAAKRAQLINGNADDTATVARRLDATNLIGKHAEEIRKTEPSLSEAQSRIEARKRWPDIAARERA